MLTRVKLTVAASLMALAMPATAATIYSNDVTTLNYGLTSSTFRGGDGDITADDFAVSGMGSGAFTVSGATWSGLYYNSQTGSFIKPNGAAQEFEIFFYASVDGRPASSPTASDEGSLFKRFVTISPTVTASGFGNYTADFTPLSLQTGQRYWFSAYAINPNLGDTWSWGGNDASGNAIQSDGGGWSAKNATNTGIEQIFTLTGPVSLVPAVPEPATWGMMILGMGLVGGTMRRKQKVATRVTFA
jgi:hypothetical protein